MQKLTTQIPKLGCGFFFFFTFTIAFSQKDSVLLKIYDQLDVFSQLLKQENGRSGRKDRMMKVDLCRDTIRVRYIDRMNCNKKQTSVQFSRSAYRKAPLDTLKLTFTVQPNWTEERFFHQKKMNKSICDQEVTRYLKYVDSVCHKDSSKIKECRSIQLLNIERDWVNRLSHWNQSNKELLAQVRRIPEFMVEDHGVFIDNDFQDETQFFVGSELVKNDLETMIRFVMELNEAYYWPFDHQVNY